MMRNATRLICALALSSALLPATGTAQSSSDSADVIDVVNRFHSALSAGDSTAALALLVDDVIVQEAGGIETRAQYRAHHLGADIEFARAVSAQRTVQQVRVLGAAAWVASTSVTRGSFRERTIDTDGAELIVLRREPHGWRIAAIHWSSRARRR